MPDIKRRDLIRFCAMSGLVLATRRVWAAGPSAPEIGLQSISIMKPLSRDPRGTLRAIAAIGYRQLETIGSLGLPDAVLADLLQDTGISAVSMHVCPASFYRTMLAWTLGKRSMTSVFAEIQEVYARQAMPALIDEAIETARAAGQRGIVWSNLLDADLANTADVERFARALNSAGRQCADAGLSFAFHNGSKGFLPVQGKRPYDILLETTDPGLVSMQMDIYWAMKVGIDPIAYFLAHPGRYRSCHLKDMDSGGRIVRLGTGTIDFAEIMAACADSGITRLFVEHDQAPHPLADISAARTYLVAINSAG